VGADGIPGNKDTILMQICLQKEGKYIQHKHSFSETLWLRSQRHKSQKFQQ